MIGRRVAALALVVLCGLVAGCGSWGEDERGDAQIQQDIATTLYASNIQNVEVAVADGIATLTGTAPDQATADRAVEIARGVQGVSDVKSNIAISAVAAEVPPPPAFTPGEPDSIAMGRINQRLIAEPKLAGSKIQPSVAGGVATLTGTVPSDEAKAVAERIAKAVEGVTSVDNKLRVVAETAAVTRPDAQIEDDVNTLLDKQFNDLTLFVEVEGGVVKLSGAIPDQPRIIQVSNAVYTIKGVKSVDTARLTVKGGEPEGQKLGAPTGT